MSAKSPHISQNYLIGRAAQLSGVSSANIRFYEKQGLIQPRGTHANSYRFYNDGDVHQLRLIRQLRSLDMTLDEVRALLNLDLRNKNDCTTARETLDEHIGHVRARLKELKALEKNLIDLRSRCNGTDDQCRLIEALHTQADSAVLNTKQGRHPYRTAL